MYVQGNLKDQINRRKRIYEGHGRDSQAWQNAKKQTRKYAKKLRSDYYVKQKEKLCTSGTNQIPYRAVKNLISSEKPKHWDIRDLGGDKTDVELAEDLAEYFNAI